MSEPRRQEQVSTRSLADKLGIKPGARVTIVGMPDPELRRILRERMADITVGDPRPASDLIFLAADSREELSRLPALRATLKPDGAIWVVSRKGNAATLRDVEVIDAAIANGLVDNKVVSFSDTHTSLRLVIPKALRAAHAAATGPGPEDE
jgi:hypothetical protein